MKILVYGAGVLGSLYAARLAETGRHDVSLLARGRRLQELSTHGIVLIDEATGRKTTTNVNLVERLLPEDHYDLIAVIMRRDHIDAVLPVLAANRHSPSVLFMVNSGSGGARWVEALGRDRVVLGFPGAGGGIEGHAVRYRILSRRSQPTTFGEPDGTVTPRLQAIVSAFAEAGFPTAVSPNMNAWLKTHAALIVPVALGIIMAGGSTYRLASMPDGPKLVLDACREGLKALRALGVAITPAGIGWLERIPPAALIPLFRRVLASPGAEVLMARHTRNAREEIRVLAAEVTDLVQAAGTPAPSLAWLCRFVDQPFVSDTA